MQVLDEVYGASYQRDSLQPEGIAAFDVIADELVKMFNPQTAMDVGCGGGALIRGLVSRGVDAYGIEGSSWAKEYMPDRITTLDLRNPHKLVIQYDLVTCTDVGEHIEHSGHETFIDTLFSLVSHNRFLVFGAAGEGQDGLGHVACEHPCYWIRLFERNGFRLRPDMSEILRAAIKARPEHAFAWWVAKNLMVFQKRIHP